MTVQYELIIYWSSDDDAFVVEVAELPGCMADGDTYEEAVSSTHSFNVRLSSGSLENRPTSA